MINGLCGWLLHCKRFLSIFAVIFVSTVVCPACLCFGIASTGPDEFRERGSNRLIDLRGPLPLPEGLTSEAELHSFHQKNKIKHFYDLSDDVPEEIWKEIVRLTGGDDVMERVHNFSILMGTGLKDLTENQEQRGSLRSMKVSLRPDGESGGGHQFSVNQRTAQELWPADSMLRWWTSVLLYASGFELPNPIDANSGCDYMRILPGIGCGGGHKIYSDERLNDTDLQEWLDTRGTFIAKHIGKKPGPFAPSEKPWDTN